MIPDKTREIVTAVTEPDDLAELDDVRAGKALACFILKQDVDRLAPYLLACKGRPGVVAAAWEGLCCTLDVHTLPAISLPQVTVTRRFIVAAPGDGSVIRIP